MDIERRKVLKSAGAIAGLSALSSVSGAHAGDTSSSAKATATATFPAKGLIAMEEACIPASVIAEWQEVLGGPYPNDSKRLLQDLTGRRLEEMDAGGIAVAALAVSVPGPQFVVEPAKAEGMAQRGNDALAKEISKRPDRFVGFASLSMHNPEAACKELERAVRDLRMRGVLLYNFQRAINDDHALFYDNRRYDAVWATLEQLDVPLYLHPGLLTGDPAGRIQDLQAYPWLDNAAWAFALHTGRHALRIITSGVFDRYPKAQMILGHNGEQIVNDLWRIDNRISMNRAMKHLPNRVTARKTVREYFRSNVHVTTSGQFSTSALQHVIDEIGFDRVMFAVDYPYESNIEATKWIHSAKIEVAVRNAVGRDNAARLLKL